MRRTLPSSASPYYSTGGGFSAPTYSSRARSTFGVNISKPGKNLMILIVLGLVIGTISEFFFVGNVQLTFYLVQNNYLVFHGWIPSLVTSIIVAPGIAGVIDVLFNAISLFFIDGLLRNVYTPRQYYLVFLLTGIAGNVVSLFGYGVGPNIIDSTTSFGASGGIFGLLAGVISADYAMSRTINRSLLIWFVIIFVYSSLGGTVDVYAHLGGAIVGLAIGYYVGKNRH